MDEPKKYAIDFANTYMSAKDICDTIRKAMIDSLLEARQAAVRHGCHKMVDELDRQIQWIKETRP